MKSSKERKVFFYLLMKSAENFSFAGWAPLAVRGRNYQISILSCWTNRVEHERQTMNFVFARWGINLGRKLRDKHLEQSTRCPNSSFNQFQELLAFLYEDDTANLSSELQSFSSSHSIMNSKPFSTKLKLTFRPQTKNESDGSGPSSHRFMIFRNEFHLIYDQYDPISHPLALSVNLHVCFSI
jgi:hypothetical protein